MDVHDGQIAVDIEIHMVGILDQRILLTNNVLFTDLHGKPEMEKFLLHKDWNQRMFYLFILICATIDFHFRDVSLQL